MSRPNFCPRAGNSPVIHGVGREIKWNSPLMSFTCPIHFFVFATTDQKQWEDLVMMLGNCSHTENRRQRKAASVCIIFIEGNCLQWIIGHLGGDHKGPVLPKTPMGVLIWSASCWRTHNCGWLCQPPNISSNRREKEDERGNTLHWHTYMY